MGISGPVTASYASHGDGLRVRKTVGGATTRCTCDVLKLPVVLAADGDEYVWGQGLIGQVTSTGTARYAHADGLGRVRRVRPVQRLLHSFWATCAPVLDGFVRITRPSTPAARARAAIASPIAASSRAAKAMMLEPPPER